MSKIKRFEDLEIWKEAAEIGIEMYKISEKSKLKVAWGMKDQLRRAAMSISDNIAEGFEYDNNKDFIKFLRYSKGSAGELRSKLYVLYNVEFISKEFYDNSCEKLIQLSRKIAGFIKYLKDYEKKKNL